MGALQQFFKESRSRAATTIDIERITLENQIYNFYSPRNLMKLKVLARIISKRAKKHVIVATVQQ
jgi:hypothetical protein